jgi:hypothetical protein
MGGVLGGASWRVVLLTGEGFELVGLLRMHLTNM